MAIVINKRERDMLEEALTHRMGQLRRKVENEKHQGIKELRSSQLEEFAALARRVAIFETKEVGNAS